METKIRLKKNDVLKVPIDDEEGNYTGNYLEFDLEDIELPLKWQMVEVEHKKNLYFLKTNFMLADKKVERKGKKMLSSVEEEKLNIVKEFYAREMKAMDNILGEGGCKKLLNGRQPYYEMFNDFIEYLDPIMPFIEKGFENAKEKIIQKYEIKEIDTLEG